MTKRTIYIGTDPEVFLRSVSTGEFVSAHGMFPGTKQQPYPLGNVGFMQVDGHALEFNSLPAESEDEFVENVTNIFEAVKREVEKVDPDLEIALEPVAHFDEAYFKSLPDESKVLGCDPDFSSMSGSVLPSPDISTKPVRTSSGHIHIGWTNFDDTYDEQVFAQRLEVANKVTPHLLKVAKRWENPASEERRRYYGREGAFRPKAYGVELRVLDCLWLKDEQSMREVYRAAYDGFMKEYGYQLAA
jgi:hypothetical protein